MAMLLKKIVIAVSDKTLTVWTIIHISVYHFAVFRAHEVRYYIQYTQEFYYNHDKVTHTIAVWK